MCVKTVYWTQHLSPIYRNIKPEYSVQTMPTTNIMQVYTWTAEIRVPERVVVLKLTDIHSMQSWDQRWRLTLNTCLFIFFHFIREDTECWGHRQEPHHFDYIIQGKCWVIIIHLHNYMSTYTIGSQKNSINQMFDNLKILIIQHLRRVITSLEVLLFY